MVEITVLFSWKLVLTEIPANDYLKYFKPDFTLKANSGNHVVCIYVSFHTQVEKLVHGRQFWFLHVSFTLEFHWKSPLFCSGRRKTWTGRHISAQSKCKCWKTFAASNMLLACRCMRCIAFAHPKLSDALVFCSTASPDFWKSLVYQL